LRARTLTPAAPPPPPPVPRARAAPSTTLPCCAGPPGSALRDVLLSPSAEAAGQPSPLMSEAVRAWAAQQEERAREREEGPDPDWAAKVGGGGVRGAFFGGGGELGGSARGRGRPTLTGQQPQWDRGHHGPWENEEALRI